MSDGTSNQKELCIALPSRLADWVRVYGLKFGITDEAMLLILASEGLDAIRMRDARSAREIEGRPEV